MKLTPINNPTALRLDTTVGTRIFSGNTMIHGDTGWRDVTALHLSKTDVLTFGSGGGLFIRRTRENLYVQLRGQVSSSASSLTSIDLPVGWRAASASSLTTMALGSGQNGHVRTVSGNALLFRAVPVGELLVWMESSTAILPATELWPSTLIGLPA